MGLNHGASSSGNFDIWLADHFLGTDVPTEGPEANMVAFFNLADTTAVHCAVVARDRTSAEKETTKRVTEFDSAGTLQANALAAMAFMCSATSVIDVVLGSTYAW